MRAKFARCIAKTRQVQSRSCSTRPRQNSRQGRLQLMRDRGRGSMLWLRDHELVVTTTWGRSLRIWVKLWVAWGLERRGQMTWKRRHDDLKFEGQLATSTDDWTAWKEWIQLLNCLYSQLWSQEKARPTGAIDARNGRDEGGGQKIRGVGPSRQCINKIWHAHGPCAETLMAGNRGPRPRFDVCHYYNWTWAWKFTSSSKWLRFLSVLVQSSS
jgi:hypothetical protein